MRPKTRDDSVSGVGPEGREAVAKAIKEGWPRGQFNWTIGIETARVLADAAIGALSVCPVPDEQDFHGLPEDRPDGPVPDELGQEAMGEAARGFVGRSLASDATRARDGVPPNTICPKCEKGDALRRVGGSLVCSPCGPPSYPPVPVPDEPCESCGEAHDHWSCVDKGLPPSATGNDDETEVEHLRHVIYDALKLLDAESFVLERPGFAEAARAILRGNDSPVPVASDQQDGSGLGESPTPSASGRGEKEEEV